MLKMNEKLFVGGYYDDRIFEGAEEKTPFSKLIDTYTLEEVLKLGFVGEGLVDWFENMEEKEWNEATKEEKIKAVLGYVEGDEIAGLLCFETELEAENYKNDVIKEIEELESNYEYNGKIQDREGFFRESYIVKE